MIDFLFGESREQRARREASARKRFEEYLLPQAVPWDFKTVKIPRKSGEELVFRDFSWGGFEPPPIGKSPSGRFERVDVTVPRGSKIAYHLRQPESMYSDGANAFIYFTEKHEIPSLWEHAKYERKVWMGLSPTEMLTQRSGIQFCRGVVVIGGLGIGWFLHEAAQRAQVTKLIVVERERELLDWYGDALCKKYNAEVICDDVWNVVGKIPSARYALDIWPHFFSAKWDRRLQAARRSGHSIWAWGSARSAAT